LEQGLTCDQQAGSITPLTVEAELFGDRESLVVGLTEDLYAATDGKNTQYFSHGQSGSSSVRRDAWGLPVEVGMGIAAVTFFNGDGEMDRNGDGSTTMLGCRCQDTEKQGMRIDCALSLYEQTYMGDSLDPLLDLTFEVRFHQDATKRYMTCEASEISVQSVKWPVTRFSEAVQNEADMLDTCYGTGTCSMVDAVIWVSPRCSSKGSANQEACLESFNDAGCFPYCMAARKAGSAASNLILYNAVEWKNRVHLLDRDCGYSYLESGSIKESVESGAATYRMSTAPPSERMGAREAEVVALNDVLTGSVVVHEWDPSRGCVSSRNARSTVGKESLEGYAGGRFSSLALPGQPFSYAGDTTLTSVRNNDDTYSIRVDRLYGNEQNEFTIINVRKDFPTNPPAATLGLDAQLVDNEGRVTIPYAFSDETGIRHPSVSTQAAVYFVVNPSNQMFQAFNMWCACGNPEEQQCNSGALQLQALSSYGSIRLWRIEAYSHCPAGDDGTSYCAGGFASFVDIPGGLADGGGNINNASRCHQDVTIKVTSLQYLNSDNIAVTYISVAFSDYDVENARVRDGVQNAYRTKYYNPLRAALSDTPWTREVGLGGMVDGRLCPAIQRMPQVCFF
jgi:hypothetical protein